MLKNIVVISLLLPSITLPQPAPIIIDGLFQDWQHISALYSNNTPNREISDYLDLKGLWISCNKRYIFLKIKISSEINIQNPNSLVMFLDTDNNTETGKHIHGIGADIEWNFGYNGVFHFFQDSLTISHHDIGLVTSPTVSSTQFEIAFNRHAELYGHKIFPRESFQILFIDNSEDIDFISEGTSVVYSFNDGMLPSIKPLSLRKQNPQHVRILTYNILEDGFLDSSRIKSLERIIRAVNPDIMGFQEIFNNTAEQTAAIIESILPLNNQQQWYYSKVDPDIIAISRYPITSTYVLPGNNGAFLIDLKRKYSNNLLLIIAHPPCCNRNVERQLEIDGLMAFIRDIKVKNSIIKLEQNTPILIIGDLNLVGYAQQLKTLLTGDIVNADQFGNSFMPDWDETPFADMLPRHIASPFTYTWYEEKSSFTPGRLDFMIYSDSVMDVGNSFVLFTLGISENSLDMYALQAQDVVVASDHLPVIADLIFANLINR